MSLLATLVRRLTTFAICVSSSIASAVTPMIAAGPIESLFLKSDGTVWAAGAATGYSTGVTSPVRQFQSLNVVAIAASYGTSMALLADGTVWAAGNNNKGQLGDGTTQSRVQPQQVAGLSGVISIKLATNALALKQDGSVWAWGDNFQGQLGDGTKTDRLVPTRVVGLSNVTRISTSASGSSALTADGTVWVWGRTCCGAAGNGQVQFPVGDVTNATTVPTRVPNFDQVIAISATGNRHMALRADGTVWSWGFGNLGEHGTGTVGDVSVPTKVQGLTNVIAIDASGANFSLALTADGVVWAWGSNSFGRLGTSSVTFSASPLRIPGISDIVAISAGIDHVLAMRRDGTVFAWGSNANGKLGDGTYDDHTDARTVFAPGGTGQFNLLSATPSVINQLPTAQISLSASTGVAPLTVQATATSANDPDGTVTGFTWRGSNGQQASGQSTTFTFTLAGTYSIYLFVTDNTGGRGTVQRQVVVTATAVSVQATPKVATGFQGSIALASDGSIRTWGTNYQLGFIDSTAQRVLPTTNSVPLITGVVGATDIANVATTKYALLADGTVLGWGGNGAGQVGSGSQISAVNVPEQVKGLPTVQAIASGPGHVLALTRDGRVFSWGSNSKGELGLGDSENRFQAAEIVGLSNVIAIAAGQQRSLVLKSDGTVWAWGNNALFELGDTTQISRNRPVQLPGVSGITKIFSGASSTSYLQRADGTMLVTGGLIILIPGDPGPSVGARRIAAYDGVTQIVGDYEHVIALKDDGTVWTGGRQSSLALGYTDGGDVATLRQVPGITNGAWVALGNNTSMVMRRDGTVVAWGINTFGQLGDGTLAQRFKPVALVNETLSGVLDLWPEVANDNGVSAPPYFSQASSPGSVTNSTLTVNSLTKFNPADVGTTSSVYVFAVAPANLVKGAALKGGAAFDDPAYHINLKTTPSIDAKDGPLACVLAQLNSAGQLTAVSASNLQAYVTGVLSAGGAAVNVLNNISAAAIQGSTFYVGYGTTGTSMISNGVNRSVVSVPGTQNCTPQAPQTGWWWDSTQRDRGYGIEVRGNNLFYASFVNNPSGTPSWMVASGPTALDGSLFQASLYSYANGQTLVGALKAPTGPTGEGLITISTATATQSTLIAPAGTRSIARMEFIPNGLNTTPQTSQPESGWWWNKDEPGRGYFIEWQNGYAKVTGYMYDDAGKPIWYQSMAPTNDPRVINGTWSIFGSGYPLTQAGGTINRKMARLTDNFQALSIRFSDATNGVMILPGGRVIAITRLRF